MTDHDEKLDKHSPSMMFHLSLIALCMFDISFVIIVMRTVEDYTIIDWTTYRIISGVGLVAFAVFINFMPVMVYKRDLKTKLTD